MIPVICGVFVAAALVMTPIEFLHGYWWMPLILDLGCAPMLALTLGYLAWRTIRKHDQKQ
jgi:hypothetical protein